MATSKKGRRPQKKMEDDLKKNRRWPQKKIEDKLKKKMEDDLKEIKKDDLKKLNGRWTNQPKSTKLAVTPL